MLDELYKKCKEVNKTNFKELIYLYKPTVNPDEFILECCSQYKKYKKVYRKDFYQSLTTDYQLKLMFLPIYEVRAKCSGYKMSHTYYVYYTVHKKTFDGIFTWNSKKDKRTTEYLNQVINYNCTYYQVNNPLNLSYNFNDLLTFSHVSEVKNEYILYDDSNFENMDRLAKNGLIDMVEKNSKKFTTANTKDIYVEKIFYLPYERAIRYLPFWVLECYDGTVHFMDAIYGHKYMKKINLDRRYYKY